MCIWSQRFAQQVVKILQGKSPTQWGDEPALPPDVQELQDEVKEAFRYLPFEQITWTQDFAGYLRRQMEQEGREPDGWLRDKLREVKEFAVYLKGRFGTELPADESDEWTDEDRHDFSLATWRRLEEEDPWPEDDYPEAEDQGNAEAR
jgi:hypothetical protein